MSGALICLLSVVLGAFGAHALKHALSVDMLAVYETALRYQMFHALALMVVGILMLVLNLSSESNHLLGQALKFKRSAVWFLLGLFLFCGSLYALVLSELILPERVKALGMITPFGGAAFIIGWFYLFLAVKQSHFQIGQSETDED
jgi:uncharacterized membrane protein YgdD (TMEM256/DUF423 family)